MEPNNRESMARAAARRKAAQRRRAMRRRRAILWALCGLMSVILVFLIVNIVKLSTEPSNDPQSTTASTQPQSSQPVPTEPTSPPPSEPTGDVPAVNTDTTPPQILGATDREFFVGDSINYKAADTIKGYQNVIATDDSGTASLSIDRSAVIPQTPGTYPVVYTATDAAGNKTSVTVQFTIAVKPSNYVEPEIVYDLARQILDEITTDGMTELEVAFKIYYWTITNIDYESTSDKSHWTGGAYQAFTQKRGDCFNYFAAAKALYDVAGIENIDVVKSDTSHSRHYWSLINLGDGWYHVDCTPRSVWGAFFMNTDAELERYSVANNNSHIFDHSLYPERATESLQHLFNYDNGTIKKDGE